MSKKKKAATKFQFPEVIHVTVDQTDEPFLLISDEFSSVENGDQMAVYKLVEVGYVEITKRLITAKK